MHKYTFNFEKAPLKAVKKEQILNFACEFECNDYR
jgi:hypothetical protein